MKNEEKVWKRSGMMNRRKNASTLEWQGWGYPSTKNKKRLVLDFYELNKTIEYHTGSNIIDICEET